MYEKILVPIDLGDLVGAEKALKNAAAMPLAEGGELHVITVVPTYGMSIVGSYFDGSFEDEATQRAQQALSEFLNQDGTGKLVTKGHVAHGSIYEEIIGAADKLKCDLIVMTGHRPEMKDYLLGPNAARVVRHANQSVMVVRD